MTTIEQLESIANDIEFGLIVYSNGYEALHKEAINKHSIENTSITFMHGMMCGVLGHKKVLALREDSFEESINLKGIDLISIDCDGAWKSDIVSKMKEANLEIKINLI